MHRPRVLDEVESCPWIAREKLRRQQIAFQAITPAARGDEVAGRVDPAFRERKDMIDCCNFEVERSGAVHAAPTAITHHGVLNGALLVAAWSALGTFGATGDSWNTRETNAVIVSTPRQFHLA
jgi:hypothetical protein